MELRCNRRDVKSFAKHGFGLVEEGGVFGEEGDERLACFDFVAQLGVHLDAGVGADGVAGFGAACAETLDGPAHLFAVHGGEVSAVGCCEGAGGGRLVVRGGVVEDGDVAALDGYDSEPRFEGCAAEEDLVGEFCSCFGSWCVACEMEHPAGENV